MPRKVTPINRPRQNHRKFLTTAQDHERGKKRYGLPKPFNHNVLPFRKKAKVDANWLDEFISRYGPYLWHQTSDNDTRDRILEEGLIPHDAGPGSIYTQTIVPRENHAYVRRIATQTPEAKGFYPEEWQRKAVAVDLRKIDPHHLNADEDAFANLNDMRAVGIPDSVDHLDRLIINYNGKEHHTPHWGHWGDHFELNEPWDTAHSLNKIGTAAIYGGVEPRALLSAEDAFVRLKKWTGKGLYPWQTQEKYSLPNLGAIKFNHPIKGSVHLVTDGPDIPTEERERQYPYQFKFDNPHRFWLGEANHPLNMPPQKVAHPQLDLRHIDNGGYDPRIMDRIPFLFDGKTVYVGNPGAYHAHISQGAGLWATPYAGTVHTELGSARWYSDVPEQAKQVYQALQRHMGTPVYGEENDTGRTPDWDFLGAHANPQVWEYDHDELPDTYDGELSPNISSNRRPFVIDRQGNIHVGPHGAFHDQLHMAMGTPKAGTYTGAFFEPGMDWNNDAHIVMFDDGAPKTSVHKAHEFFGLRPNEDNPWEFGSSKTAEMNLQWEPGNNGKGFVLNGQLHTWNVSEFGGEPHHSEVWQTRQKDGEAPQDEFHISPSGAVMSEFWTEPQRLAEAIKQDGRLRYDPGQSAWDFGPMEA